MTDQSIIKRAVELADGFELWTDQNGVETVTMPDGHAPAFCDFIEIDQYKDALAAQLVRQVDFIVMPNRVDIYHDVTQVFFDDATAERMIAYSGGPDRTMNTIKAIVESGVLDD